VADRITKQRRSWNMSRIRGVNTKPELLVRSLLHGMGFRYRLHVRALPGCPDIVLPRWKSAVLVHGCFWHRHHGCRLAYTPKSRKAFWTKKFQGNVNRDKKASTLLRRLGWRVFVVWECELQNRERLARRLRRGITK
jgi:DNA mismatch endonuclease (patch repair protein)